MAKPSRAWDVMLRAALRHKDVEQGIACEGTALESLTVKVNGRAFLFLNPKKAYFKLAQSYPAAQQAATITAAIQPGGAGWTSLLWTEPCPVSDDVLRQWVDESHDLMVTGPKSSVTVGLLAMKPESKKTVARATGTTKPKKDLGPKAK